MDVRILGPLEVVVDRRPSVVPGAAERELLARLAVSVGSVVSADRLIDDLWGDRLPIDATNALQTRVSKLRRAFGNAGADPSVVATQPPGYVLRIDPNAVDARRALALLADARRSAQRGAHAAAAAGYAEALSTWRGPALIDFTATWATNESARLEELRLVAIEERNDLLLAMGQHADVVAELESLVAAHPLRERLRAQLMLALYRSGRQADALAAFADARRTLAEEVGLDPGEELQRLEAAMLRRDPDLASPPRTATAARVVLPRRRASFLGRDDDVETVVRLLDEQPLVTLTGPGGAGKTTLAIEASRRIGDRFADGGAFVPLSGVTDPERVPHAVAEALDIPPESRGGAGAGSAGDRLVAALASRHALLVLDNCEHLAAAAAVLADRLLDECPDLRVLATSREPLGVDGEAQLGVQPLPLPADDADPNEMRRSPAVQLFVDRALAVDATFAPSDDDVAAVHRICVALDGMPLAIELAAARVKLLSVESIAERLDDRFSLLAHGRRTAEARQQTLRAAVDWSHDLLSRGERRLFRRLSVFRGGWTVDAMEEVCSGDGLDPHDLLDLLGRLVDRSLVVADTASSRFRMLETLRHYGLERLAEAAEAEQTRTRHVRCFLAVAERAEIQLRGHQQAAWLERMRAERDNLYQALEACAADPDRLGEEGLRLVGALGWWWYLGRHDEGRRWVDRMLDAGTPASPAAMARAHRAAALVWRPGACVVHPSDRCADESRAALAAAQAVGDAAVAAYARALLAVEAVGAADLDTAAHLLEEATQGFRELDDGWGHALVAFVRSEIAFQRGSLPFSEALGLSAEAASAFEALGDGWGRSAVLAHQAHALERRGRIAEALAVGDAAVAVARRLGLQTTLQWMLAETGFCRLLLDEHDASAALFSEAREVARLTGGGPGEPFAELGFAALGRLRGDLVAARTHYLRAVEGCSSQGMRHELTMALTGLGAVDIQLGDPGGARRHHTRALQIGIDSDDLGAVATALEGLAAASAADGDGVAAATLLGSAGRVRDEAGLPANALDQRTVEDALAAARTLIGEHDVDRAVARGRGLTPRDLLASAAAV